MKIFPTTYFSLCLRASVAKLFSIFLLLSFLFTSCARDEKKEARNKWFTYLIAVVVPKHPGIGTDSMEVDFQNHSAYKIDSVVLLFRNKGLLINSTDSLFATNIPAGGHVKMPVPYHVLGVSHHAEFAFIRSKELEFRFQTNSLTAKDDRDPYYCK